MYGQKQAAKLGIETGTVDITPFVDSLAVYSRRNQIIRQIIPEFEDTLKFHVTLPQNLLESDRLNYHSITVEVRTVVKK
jgi:hypothetical protein